MHMQQRGLCTRKTFSASTASDETSVHFVYLVRCSSYSVFCALGVREHVTNNSSSAREEAGKRYTPHR